MVDFTTLSPDTPMQPVDWLFQQFVHAVATDVNAELPVILAIGGAVVSGRLIGPRRYFQEFGAEIAKNLNASEEQRQALQRGYMDLAEKNDESLRRRVAEDSSPLQFFYLRDARFIGGVALSSAEGLLWRGRVASIDGWSVADFRP